jgi:hypothetical protein
MRYCVARGADLGPIGENLGAACGQINRAHTLLAGLHDRAWHGRVLPERVWPEISRSRRRGTAGYVVGPCAERLGFASSKPGVLRKLRLLPLEGQAASQSYPRPAIPRDRRMKGVVTVW